jgi:hypothetical protein
MAAKTKPATAIPEHTHGSIYSVGEHPEHGGDWTDTRPLPSISYVA